MRNLHVTIGPDDWTGPAPGGDLDAQIMTDSIQKERDDRGRETGWVTAQCWRNLPGEPAPTHARVRVRAAVLAELRP